MNGWTDQCTQAILVKVLASNRWVSLLLEVALENHKDVSVCSGYSGSNSWVIFSMWLCKISYVIRNGLGTNYRLFTETLVVIPGGSHVCPLGHRKSTGPLMLSSTRGAGEFKFNKLNKSVILFLKGKLVSIQYWWNKHIFIKNPFGLRKENCLPYYFSLCAFRPTKSSMQLISKCLLGLGGI